MQLHSANRFSSYDRPSIHPPSMKLVIARRTPGIAWSMDVYADNLISQIQQLRPNWDVIQWSPSITSWRSGSGLRKYYERYWRYPRALRQVSGDIFHVLDHTDGHLVRWLHQAGKSVVATCHDLVSLTYPEHLREESRFPLISETVWRHAVHGLCQADQVLCVSESTERDVFWHLKVPLMRTNVIHSGINPAFRPLPRSHIATIRQNDCHHPQEWVLLHVGSNQRCKNLTGVLEALKILRDRQIPARLWQVGAQFTQRQQQYIEQQQLGNFITSLGSLNPRTQLEQLVEIYNAADVTVFPSFYEGFGFPILESMACGTPVVTSDVFAMPEVAGNAGILVNPSVADSIAAGIAKLYHHSAYRQEMIQRGLTRAQQFHWRTTAQQTIELYERMQVQQRSAELMIQEPSHQFQGML